jgi:protein-S-isoprenylcysteine O-methyltransferase Ste14
VLVIGPVFVRALVAFLALPGVFAILVPILWLRGVSHTVVVHPAGLVLLAIGFAALLACVRDFYVAGKGTLAPWSPPQRLVTVGLYRYTRNPMYVAVTTILFGWASAFEVPGLFVYALVVAMAFHVRVVTAEEPFLARTHGAAWERYRTSVPRWVW